MREYKEISRVSEIARVSRVVRVSRVARVAKVSREAKLARFWEFVYYEVCMQGRGRGGGPLLYSIIKFT